MRSSVALACGKAPSRTAADLPPSWLPAQLAAEYTQTRWAPELTGRSPEWCKEKVAWPPARSVSAQAPWICQDTNGHPSRHRPEEWSVVQSFRWSCRLRVASCELPVRNDCAASDTLFSKFAFQFPFLSRCQSPFFPDGLHRSLLRLLLSAYTIQQTQRGRSDYEPAAPCTDKWK